MWDARTVIKHPDYYSVEVINPVDNRSYWVDLAVKNGDIEVDWNQYIFNENNPEDLIRKKAQDNLTNFDDATSVAVCLLESKGFIEQDEEGTWQVIK